MKLDHEAEEAVSILAAGCGLTALILVAAVLVALLANGLGGAIDVWGI